MARLRGLRGLALAVLVAGGGPVLAQGQAVDPIQQRFADAIALLDAGRADDAVAALAVLAAQVDAPRIRLELARSLYMAGRLKEARREFLRVYALPDLPYAVRRTINVFLADIDQRAGFFQPSLSLAVDSNPLQTPSSGIYDIFGIPLEYKSDAKTETGLRVDAQGAAPLGRTGLSVIGSAAITRFANDRLGQWNAHAALRRPDANRRGWWSVGGAYYERKGYDPASTLYVEKVRRLTMPDQSKQLVARVSISRTTIRNQDHLNGWGLDGGLDYGFDLNANTAVNLSAGLGHAGAEYAVDRRLYGSLGAGLTAALPRWNKTVAMRATAGQTRYGDIDPFFGARRDDKTLGLEARLLDGRPIRGLFPSVSVTWDRRKSSIPFFDYERTGFNVGLQRRF